MKKIKNYIISKSVIIMSVFAYIMTAIISGCVEYFNGVSFKVVLFLRIGTMVIDAIIIGLGIYAFMHKWVNKELLKSEFFKKRISWLVYITDTFVIFSLIWVPYLARNLFLWLDGEKIGMPISTKTFWINVSLGLGVVLLLGAKASKIINKLEERAKHYGCEKEDPKINI